MAWQDDIARPFNITTPDGVIYTVLWKTAEKEVKWHGETFPFIKVQGAMQRKELLNVRTFPMEFYFQGDDHVDDSKRFEKSLNSRGPCIIDHPLYDTIIAQIFEIKFQNSGGELNTTKITCTALETIDDNALLLVSSPVSVIQLKQAALDDANPPTLTAVPSFQETDQLKQVMNANKRISLSGLNNFLEQQDYLNAFNRSINAIDTITTFPILAMQTVINVVTLPAKFSSNVQTRIQILSNMWDNLLRTLVGTFSPAKKQLFQIQGSSILSAMCGAAISPLAGNYTTTRSVLSISQIISSTYSSFVQTLDGLEISIGGPSQVFISDFDVLVLLQDLVNITISQLVLIALNGKQERKIILQEDSDVITLAHRFYGPDKNDLNLQFFMSTNGITYKDVWLIRAGTTITYFV